jgi:hypothetical protein
MQDAISDVLEGRFRKAGKRLMTRIREIEDVNELHALHRFSVVAENLQAIRAYLPPRQS